MTSFCAPLPYKTLFFTGEDSLSFLQGQLTQDLNIISSSSCQYAAYCDPKGRMLASLLINNSSSGYYLRLHESIFDTIEKRLKMFIMRSKVHVETADFLYYGLNTKKAHQLCSNIDIPILSTFETHQENGFILNALPHNNFELAISPAHHLAETFIGSNDIDEIMTHRMLSGHFDIQPETSETIFPQQTALETWGGINYKKGCYVGQEIIARSKYKGKVTKSMAAALIPESVSLSPLEKITAEQRTVGQIIQSWQTKEHTACLAIVSEHAFEQSVTVAGNSTSFNRIEL